MIKNYRALALLGISWLLYADVSHQYTVAQQLYKDKKYEQALAVYDEILDRDIHEERACVEAARIALGQGNLDKARDYLLRQKAYGMPRQVDVAFSYGHLLLSVGFAQDAYLLYDDLHRRCPDYAPIWYNLAYISKMVVSADACIDILEQIVAEHPDYEDAQFSLGHSYLAGGYWQKGWRQHDRFLRRTRRYTPALRTWIEQNELAGKKILLTVEGGLGDTIQFIRCAAWLKDRGARVYAIVQKPLLKLLSRCPFVDEFFLAGQNVPQFDATTTFMTVPALCNADESQMSAGVPYIFPDPDLERFWEQELAQDKKIRVGICWQADVHNDESRLTIARRGVPLKLLLRLAEIPGISLYCLQCQDGLDEYDSRAQSLIHSFGDDFDRSHGSFMDTAAVMKQLNLVISADTAVAHLAGALGVPVWLLLPYSVDWRWVLGRTDSPWYPSMRIFKQPAPFDWDSVICEVVAALEEFAA